MYTVCRFSRGPHHSDEELARIGQALNRIRPGQFERLDRVGGRFSVSVSTGSTWQAHLVAIREYVHAMSDVIAQSKALDISVEIDIACEPDDLGHVDAFLSCAVPSAVLREFGERGITLVLTCYKA
jgi:hypothetical protein